MIHLINGKVLLSGATILAAAALVIGGTFAFFSDTETSTGNTFAAGKLDLKIDFDGYYNELPDGTPNAGSWNEKDLEEGIDKFFDFDDIKPGDFGEGTISLHVLDNDAWGRLVITDVLDEENGCGGEEEAVENCNTGNDGELREALLFSAFLDQGSTPGFQCGNPILVGPCADTAEGNNIQDNPTQEPTVITSGTIDTGGETHLFAPALTAIYTASGCNDVDGNTDYGVCHGLAADGRLVASTVYYLGINWNLPGSTGNEIQTDSLTATIRFDVEQWRNNPTPTGF